MDPTTQKSQTQMEHEKSYKIWQTRRACGPNSVWQNTNELCKPKAYRCRFLYESDIDTFMKDKFISSFFLGKFCTLGGTYSTTSLGRWQGMEFDGIAHFSSFLSKAELVHRAMIHGHCRWIYETLELDEDFTGIRDTTLSPTSYGIWRKHRHLGYGNFDCHRDGGHTDECFHFDEPEWAIAYHNLKYTKHWPSPMES